MADIASLSVKLGLVTVDFDKGADGAIAKAQLLRKTFDDLGGTFKQFSSMWKTLGGGIGVSTLGLGALIQQTASFADKISDLAQGLGVTTGFALQFNQALRDAGVNGDAAGKIISKLFDNIEQAREGNQGAVDGFRKLGISFDEIKQMKPEDAIRRVVASLADLQKQDPIKYVSELRKQLGKGGLGLDAEQLNAVIKDGVGAFAQYGDKLEKVAKIKDNLAQSFDNLLIAFSSFIGPLTHDGIVSVEKFTAAMAGLGTYFVASKILGVALAFVEVAKAVEGVTVATAALNLVMGAGGMGLLIKAVALGAGALMYLESKGTFNGQKGSDNPMGDFGGGASEPSASTGGGAGRGSVNPSAPMSAGGSTPAEIAASAQLLLDTLKTTNMETAAGIAYWDKYGKEVFSVGSDAALAFEQIKVKRLELQEKFKTDPQSPLLGIELSRLKQQEKQILLNRDAKLKELKITKEIADIEQERARQQGYLEGNAKMLEDSQSRALQSRKYEFDATIQGIEADKQRNLLMIDGNVLLTSRQKEIAKVNLEHQSTIDKLQQELNQLPEFIDMPKEMLSKEAEANNQRVTMLQKQIADENDRHNLRMNNIAQERDFGLGAQETFNRLVDEGTNAFKTGGDMIASVFSNMDSALKSFVETGTLDFNKLIMSMVKDLMYLQMRAQMMSLASSLFNGIFNMGAKSGGSGVDYSLSGGGGVSSGLGLKMASGGDVMAGQPYYVGENGPEMFVPGQKAGTIIPNNKLDSMGGQPSVVYNGPYIANMSAIDTQSAAQFLASNKQSVWASYQSANRSVPFSR